LPPKAKRYRVWMRETITNRWIAVGTELTSADSNAMLRGMNCVEARRELITDD